MLNLINRFQMLEEVKDFGAALYSVFLIYVFFLFRVGLIEWMNDTIPLKEFLICNLTEQETKFVSGK